MSSFGVTLTTDIPELQFGQGGVVRLLRLDIEPRENEGVQLVGGQQIGLQEFKILPDGAAEEVRFLIPCRVHFQLNFGDLQGRHLETTKVYWSPAQEAIGDMALLIVTRYPGGVTTIRILGNYPMNAINRWGLHAAEITSQTLARMGFVITNNFIKAGLARSNKFGLFQVPNMQWPDGPWSEQYDLLLTHVMYYDANDVPTFVQITEPHSYKLMVTQDELDRARMQLPAPPENPSAQWYVNPSTIWQPPQPVTDAPSLKSGMTLIGLSLFGGSFLRKRRAA
jgi:hypothetical protein